MTKIALYIEDAEARLANEVEQTFVELLQLAAPNDGMPLETPLRWAEGYFEGETSPKDISLWISLGKTTKLNITRHLDTDHNPLHKEWVVSATGIMRPGDPKTTTSLTTYADHSPAIGRTGKNKYGSLVEQKIAHIASLSESLEEAREYAPALHEQYIKDENIDVSFGLFELLGSTASKEAVARL